MVKNTFNNICIIKANLTGNLLTIQTKLVILNKFKISVMLAENWHNESLVKHTYKRGFHSYISILSEIYACADPEKKSMERGSRGIPKFAGRGGGVSYFRQ